jgi:hypothetical protein
LLKPKFPLCTFAMIPSRIVNGTGMPKDAVTVHI